MSKKAKEMVNATFDPENIADEVFGGIRGDVTGLGFVNGKTKKAKYDKKTDSFDAESLANAVDIVTAKGFYYALGTADVKAYYFNSNLANSIMSTIGVGVFNNYGTNLDLTFARGAATSQIYAYGQNVTLYDTAAGDVYAGGYKKFDSKNLSPMEFVDGYNTINVVNSTVNNIYAGGDGDTMLQGDVTINVHNSKVGKIYAGGKNGAWVDADVTVVISNNGVKNYNGANMVFNGAIYGTPADAKSTVGAENTTSVVVNDYKGAYSGSFNYVDTVVVNGDSSVTFNGAFKEVGTIAVAGGANAVVNKNGAYAYELVLTSDTLANSAAAMLTINKSVKEVKEVVVTVNDDFVNNGAVTLISWAGYVPAKNQAAVVPSFSVMNENGGYYGNGGVVAEYMYEFAFDAKNNLVLNYTGAAAVLSADGDVPVFGAADDKVVVSRTFNHDGVILDLGAGANEIDIRNATTASGAFAMDVTKNKAKNTVNAKGFDGDVVIEDHTNGDTKAIVIVDGEATSVDFNKSKDATLIVDGVYDQNDQTAAKDFSVDFASVREEAVVKLANGAAIDVDQIKAGANDVVVKVDDYNEATLDGLQVEHYIHSKNDDNFTDYQLELGENAVLNTASGKVVSNYSKNIEYNNAANVAYNVVNGDMSSDVLVENGEFTINNYGTVSGEIELINGAVVLNNYGTFTGTLDMNDDNTAEIITNKTLANTNANDGKDAVLDGNIYLGGGRDTINAEGDNTISATITKKADSALYINVSNGTTTFNGSIDYTAKEEYSNEFVVSEDVKAQGIANTEVTVSDAKLVVTEGAELIVKKVTLNNAKVEGAFDAAEIAIDGGHVEFETDEEFHGKLTVGVNTSLKAQNLKAENIDVKAADIDWDGELEFGKLEAEDLTVAGTDAEGNVVYGALRMAGEVTAKNVVAGEITGHNGNWGDLTAVSVTAMTGNVLLDKAVVTGDTEAGVSGDIIAENGNIQIAEATVAGKIEGKTVVIYDGTSVGNVTATEGQASLTDVNSGNITANGKVTFTSTNADEKVTAGTITANNFMVDDDNNPATPDVVAKVGNVVVRNAATAAITAANNVTAANVEVTGDITAGNNMTLDTAAVTGNIAAAAKLDIVGEVSAAAVNADLVAVADGAATKVTATLNVGALNDSDDDAETVADISVGWNDELNINGTAAEGKAQINANATVVNNSVINLKDVDFNGTITEVTGANGAVVGLDNATVDAIVFNGSKLNVSGEANVVGKLTIAGGLTIDSVKEEVAVADAIAFGAPVTAAGTVSINGVDVTVADAKDEDGNTVVKDEDGNKVGELYEITAGTVEVTDATVTGDINAANVTATDAVVEGAVTGDVTVKGDFTAGVVTGTVTAEADDEPIEDTEDTVADNITFAALNGALTVNKGAYESIKINALNGSVNAMNSDIEVADWTDTAAAFIVGADVKVTAQTTDIDGAITATAGDVTIDFTAPVEEETREVNGNIIGKNVTITGATAVNGDITVNDGEISSNVALGGNVTINKTWGADVKDEDKKVTYDLTLVGGNEVTVNGEGVTLNITITDYAGGVFADVKGAADVNYIFDGVQPDGFDNAAVDVTIKGNYYGDLDPSLEAATVTAKSLTFAGADNSDAKAVEAYFAAEKADAVANSQYAVVKAYDTVAADYANGFVYADATVTDSFTTDKFFIGKVSSDAAATITFKELATAAKDYVEAVAPGDDMTDKAGLTGSTFTIVYAENATVVAEKDVYGRKDYFANKEFKEGDNAREMVIVTNGAEIIAKNVTVEGDFFGDINATGDVELKGAVIAGGMTEVKGVGLDGKPVETKYTAATITAGYFKNTDAAAFIKADITATAADEYVKDAKGNVTDELKRVALEVVADVDGSLTADNGSIVAKAVTGDVWAAENATIVGKVGGYVFAGGDATVTGNVTDFVYAYGNATVTGNVGEDVTTKVDGKDVTTFVGGDVGGADVKLTGNAGDVTATAGNAYVEGKVTSVTAYGKYEWDDKLGADVYVGGGNVKVEGYVANDVQADVKAEITGNVDGDVYAIGGDAIVDGKVAGSITSDAGNVTVTGTVGGDVNAAKTATLGGNVGTVEKDKDGKVLAYVGGDVTADAVVKGSAALTDIYGTVTANKIDLAGVTVRGVEAKDGNVTVGNVNGDFAYTASKNAVINAGNVDGSSLTIKNSTAKENLAPALDVKATFGDVTVETVSFTGSTYLYEKGEFEEREVVSTLDFTAKNIVTKNLTVNGGKVTINSDGKICKAYDDKNGNVDGVNMSVTNADLTLNAQIYLAGFNATGTVDLTVNKDISSGFKYSKDAAGKVVTTAVPGTINVNVNKFTVGKDAHVMYLNVAAKEVFVAERTDRAFMNSSVTADTITFEADTVEVNKYFTSTSTFNAGKIVADNFVIDADVTLNKQLEVTGDLTVTVEVKKATNFVNPAIVMSKDGAVYNGSAKVAGGIGFDTNGTIVQVNTTAVMGSDKANGITFEAVTDKAIMYTGSIDLKEGDDTVIFKSAVDTSASSAGINGGEGKDRIEVYADVTLHKNGKVTGFEEIYFGENGSFNGGSWSITDDVKVEFAKAGEGTITGVTVSGLTKDDFIVVGGAEWAWNADTKAFVGADGKLTYNEDKKELTWGTLA